MPFIGFGYLLSLICAYHVYHTGRSYVWLVLIFLAPGLGPLIYVAVVLLGDGADTRAARRFADNVANTVDPGRSYREKLREVETVGSADAKRALAEECIKRGRFQDAVDLYQAAMTGPLGASDPALLRGMGRAKLLAGDGAGAVAAFEKLREVDKASFDVDVELDYARALVLMGRTDEALREYEFSGAALSGRRGALPLCRVAPGTGSERTRPKAVCRDRGFRAPCAGLLPQPPARMVSHRQAALGQLIKPPSSLFRIRPEWRSRSLRRRPVCVPRRRASWTRPCPLPDRW